MSDFHPETWNPMWCVGTILTGVLSFMLEETPTTGAVEEPVSDSRRRQLATESMGKNLREAKFRALFPDAEEQLAAAMAAVQGSESEKPAAASASASAEEAGEGGITVGAKVCIDGIKSRPEVNGQIGIVKEYLRERERYNI